MTPVPAELPLLRWRMTAAYRRALGLGVGGLAVGAATGSAEVALLAVPLTLCAALAAGPRPGLTSAPALVRAARSAAVGEPFSVTVEITAAAAAAAAEVVVVRVPGQGPDGVNDPTAGTVAVRPGARRRSLVSTTVPRTWGRRAVARPDALVVAHDGMVVVGPVAGPVRDLLVVPAVDAAAAGPVPPHATSVVGRHPTRRTGDGSDLYSVDAFRPGDRLRHIDWRATARRGHQAGGLTVHVRRAVVEAEGQVVLLLDTRADLDTDVATWAVPRTLDGGALGPGSSLDLAVSSATALAAAHLQAGDRVSTVDLTVPGAAVRPGSGRRHLYRLRTALAGTAATGTSVTGPGRGGPDRSGPDGGGPDRSGPDRSSLDGSSRVRVPRRLLEQAPARALVVVLSPFVDDGVADLALALRRLGRTTVGVDCLPGGLEADRSSPLGPAALQLVLAEREQRLARLAIAGVVVLPAGADLGVATRRLVRARQRASR